MKTKKNQAEMRLQLQQQQQKQLWPKSITKHYEKNGQRLESRQHSGAFWQEGHCGLGFGATPGLAGSLSPALGSSKYLRALTISDPISQISLPFSEFPIWVLESIGFAAAA